MRVHARFLTGIKYSDVTRPSFASLVQTALAQSAPESFHPSVRAEDSDDWLDIDGEEFSKLLTKKVEDSAEAEQGRGDGGEQRENSMQASKLKELASRVQGFVEGQGSLEGALFEK